MGRKRKRVSFVCQQCGTTFEATVCASGLCVKCRQHKHGDAPRCACGCGEVVSWQMGKGGGWRKYVQGHHLRDPQQINPGFQKGHETWNKGHVAYTFVCAYEGCQKVFQHSDKTRQYCSQECAGLAARGREPWHKGLTKRDDYRLVALGCSVAHSRLLKPVHNLGKTKRTYEPLKRAGKHISISLKGAYASGKLVPPNKGMTLDNPRWAAICEKIGATKAYQISCGISTGSWHKHTRVGWMLNTSTGEVELFRSSYEAAYMDLLNQRGVRWTTRHGITVKWRNDAGRQHFYVPDFQVWLNESQFEIHEIKSTYFLAEEERDNQYKFHAAIRKGWREGWEFKVLTEQTNPELIGFDPTTSPWFVGYDKKTLKLIELKA